MPVRLNVGQVILGYMQRKQNNTGRHPWHRFTASSNDRQNGAERLECRHSKKSTDLRIEIKWTFSRQLNFFQNTLERLETGIAGAYNFHRFLSI